MFAKWLQRFATTAEPDTHLAAAEVAVLHGRFDKLESKVARLAQSSGEEANHYRAKLEEVGNFIETLRDDIGSLVAAATRETVNASTGAARESVAATAGSTREIVEQIATGRREVADVARALEGRATPQHIVAETSRVLHELVTARQSIAALTRLVEGAQQDDPDTIAESAAADSIGAASSLIYLGRDVVIVHYDQPHAECVYITFDHMRPGRAGVRALGRSLISQYGFGQVHIFATANHWFQTPEMVDALAAVNGVTARHARRVVWGSSMGGFAALQFADRLGADAVIASSPQISIDPIRVPWDLRYRLEAACVPAFIHDDIEARDLPRETYVVFDPGQHIDVLNARAIQKARPRIRTIVMPFSGHEPFVSMRRQGIAEAVLGGIGKAEFNLAQFAKMRRSTRRNNPQYIDSAKKWIERRGMT